MKKTIAIACFLLTLNILALSVDFNKENHRLYPVPGSFEKINPVALYEGEPEEDLSNVMVPIPLEERVFNKTGVQCVWATIETCGNYAQEPKLLKLTNNNDCKSYATPISAAKKLKELNVKFEQTTKKSNKDLILKSVVKEKRGCLFGIPGHAMTLVHYDEKNKTVKYINNSDPSLLVRTWTMDEFNKYWNGWIIVIYADNDTIENKYKAFNLPIKDKNNPQGKYSKDYIIKPKN